MARAACRSAAVIVLLVVGLLSVTALVAAGLLLPIPRPPTPDPRVILGWNQD